jgi:hypothetical protein
MRVLRWVKNGSDDGVVAAEGRDRNQGNDDDSGVMVMLGEEGKNHPGATG